MMMKVSNYLIAIFAVGVSVAMVSGSAAAADSHERDGAQRTHRRASLLHDSLPEFNPKSASVKDQNTIAKEITGTTAELVEEDNLHLVVCCCALVATVIIVASTCFVISRQRHQQDFITIADGKPFIQTAQEWNGKRYLCATDGTALTTSKNKNKKWFFDFCPMMTSSSRVYVDEYNQLLLENGQRTSQAGGLALYRQTGLILEIYDHWQCSALFFARRRFCLTDNNGCKTIFDSSHKFREPSFEACNNNSITWPLKLREIDGADHVLIKCDGFPVVRYNERAGLLFEVFGWNEDPLYADAQQTLRLKLTGQRLRTVEEIDGSLNLEDECRLQNESEIKLFDGQGCERLYLRCDGQVRIGGKSYQMEDKSQTTCRFERERFVYGDGTPINQTDPETFYLVPTTTNNEHVYFY